MFDDEEGPIIKKVWAEQGQQYYTRKGIIEKIEDKIGRPILVYYTSFSYPVMIEDTDADIIEGILQKLDLSDGLSLIINSPGGFGTAAERIINVCRKYSKTGEFWTIVPSRAKSAATMVCFGSSKIIMGPTAELGPIDPVYFDKNEGKRFSVYNLIKSYYDLFNAAVNSDGNLEPFIQQLSKFDAREIREFESAIELSGDIAIRALEQGMMKGCSRDEIKEKIKIFLTPEETKTHERAISSDEALSCGLNIEELGTDNKLWELLYELHIRTDNFCNNYASKCIESRFHNFAAAVPSMEQETGEQNA